MMRWQRTLFPTLLIASASGYLYIKYSRIKSVSPSPIANRAFESLITFRRPSSWGLYQRIMDKPLSDSSENTIPSDALAHACKSFFTSRPYKLELLLSGANLAEIDQLDFHRLGKGDQIGNLTVKSITTSELILHYTYPGFDFDMYISAEHDRLECGFADYANDSIQELGARVFLPIVLESAANRLKKTYYIGLKSDSRSTSKTSHATVNTFLRILFHRCSCP